MNHTLVPWEVVIIKSTNVIHQAETGRKIATIHNGQGKNKICYEEAQANLNLFYAAPDMLDMLIRINDPYDCLWNHKDVWKVIMKAHGLDENGYNYRYRSRTGDTLAHKEEPEPA